MNKKTQIITLIFLLLGGWMTSCTNLAKTNKKEESKAQLSDDSLLTKIQHQTFQYFWDGAEPT